MRRGFPQRVPGLCGRYLFELANISISPKGAKTPAVSWKSPGYRGVATAMGGEDRLKIPSP
ncbi:hypothetical protein MHPYR_210080 [uncultured Mycobacterium sp.]|uniref:Uncharacterized protein n=1 Tax=uncultured Mycobacterium sp. TaxID=171292 RepID=A0A1Y5P9B9_9MYCO|nr:hypothetical protein MHPYR_210080 [uncultured Mycobacterium sp.]